MTLAGWFFMSSSLALVWTLAGWCCYKVLTAPADSTESTIENTTENTAADSPVVDRH